MALVKLGTKAVGSIVKIKENGVPQEYIAVQHGKPSAMYDDSFNGVTILLRKNIYENRQWHSSNVNDYAGSTIHSHLNSTFLSLLDKFIQESLKTVKIPYRHGSGTSKTVNSGASGLAAKIFLLSCIEAGGDPSWMDFVQDGAMMAYFEFGNTTSAQSKRTGYLGGIGTRWWFRTPQADGSVYARLVNPYGLASHAGYCTDAYGVRPALALPSDLLIDDDGNVVPYKPGTLGEQDIGAMAKVKVGGIDKECIVVHKDSPSALYYGFEDGVVVMLKDIYENRKWHSSNVNDYANSDIHFYLNNSFLNLIEQDIRAAIKQVKIPYRPGSGTSMTVNSGASGLSAKVFLLSAYEVLYEAASSDGYLPVDGATLFYFSGADSAKRIGYLNGAATPWWFRTPYTYSGGALTYRLSRIGNNGGLSTGTAPTEVSGVRPAFVLPSTAIVNADGTLSFNQPPTDPGPISYSGKARAGKEITVTSEGSTDPEGNSFVYYWEWRTDTDVYQQLGITSEPTITVTVPTSGTLWQVRVKAVDEKGGESGWRTGTALTISYNDPPAISDDTDGSLGDLTNTGLTYSYTVTDDKDASLAVTITIDGKAFRSLTVPAGQKQTFTLTEEEWQQILNGDHTLTVTAKDADGESATRSVTFSRNQRVIDFQLREPKVTASRTRRIHLILNAETPPGHELTVLASNNALDESPVWEDITQSVQNSRAHVFQNETAEAWALDIHVTLDRAEAVGPCYITGMTVGYDTEGSNTAQVEALNMQTLALTEMVVDQEYRMLLIEMGVM